VISSHPKTAMSLEFCPLIKQSYILPDGWVYVPQTVLFPVMPSPCESFIWLGHTLAIVAADREFWGRKYKNKDKKVATLWGSQCWHCWKNV